LNSENAIQILPSHHIDKLKWDDCIRRSSNAVIYAYSYYLDAMCENWSGIIHNDYETVMPVPWKKKFGIAYSYQVPFVQQLGFFPGQNSRAGESLLTRLTKAWKYGDYSFNFQNTIAASEQKTCTNYIIDLSQSYENISVHYNDYLRAFLRKSKDELLAYNTDTDIEGAVFLYKQFYGKRFSHVREKDFTNFCSLCFRLQEKGQVLIRKVTDAENRLMAIVLILKDEKRMYNIINVITEEGRKKEANLFLYDCIVREFSGSRLIFDFEGSDLPGVKFFYEKFNPLNQPFIKIHYNHLPFPIRIFKK